jgi:hypothetical protein
MKHPLTILTLGIALLILGEITKAEQSTTTNGSPAATTNTNHVDQRQENQQKRIDQGIQSGRLTEQEQKRLQTQQTHIQNMETRANKDGKVTKRESARINRAQNRSSRAIYGKKHNRRK